MLLQFFNKVCDIHVANISHLLFYYNSQSDYFLYHYCDMNTFNERVRLVRKELGLTQKELAKLSGISQATIGDIERGRNKGSKELVSIAKALGVNPNWLAKRKGQKESNGLVGTHNITDTELDIPLLANNASMGDGSQSLDVDMVIGALSVKKEWIAKQLPNISGLSNLCFIHGLGDSMSPTFSDGDVLLVDSGVLAPDVDGIYVMESGSKTFIKRISRRFDGSHAISSDNRSVQLVEELNGNQQVTIKGRVVWAWNGKRL